MYITPSTNNYLANKSWERIKRIVTQSYTRGGFWLQSDMEAPDAAATVWKEETWSNHSTNHPRRHVALPIVLLLLEAIHGSWKKFRLTPACHDTALIITITKRECNWDWTLDVC
jgi:hypothetical protein